MNILHLIENLDIGGAQVRLINDLKFMDRKRFNNVVCSLTGKGSLAMDIAALGIKTYTLNGIYNVGNFFKLANIIKQNRIDIIHTQLFFADLYGRIAGKLLGVPFIVTTVQSSAHEPDSGYLYSPKRKLLDRFSGWLCNKKYIAVSESVKCSIIRHLKINPEKIEVILNYVDIDELNKVKAENLNTLRRKLSLNTQDTVLITVGRLNPAKGIQYLLKALSKVIKHHKSIKLVIIGDGFYRKYLEGLSCDYGLIDNVIFLGERNDAKEILHICDIFVFPSLSEGLPLSLLEAMAIGKPCIASHIGPNQEVITDGDNGILFKPKDSDALEKAIITLIFNPEKAKRLGQNARDYIRIKFDPLNNARLLEEFYSNLVSRK